MSETGKEAGEIVVEDMFNPRSDIKRDHVLAARSNYIVDQNMNQLVSVIFPSDMEFYVHNPDGSLNDAATEILTNMAWSKEANLWYYALQLYDDIVTWGCAITNRFYESIDGVWELNLRRLPPESFNVVSDSSIKGQKGQLLEGLISTSKGIRAFQSVFDDSGKIVTSELPADSILILTDPRYSDKVGGRSRLRGVIPLLRNLNQAFVNFGRTVERVGIPKFYAQRTDPYAAENPEQKAATQKMLSAQAEGMSFEVPAHLKIDQIPFSANNIAEKYLDRVLKEIKDFFNPTAWISTAGVSLVGSMKSQMDLLKVSISGQRKVIEDIIEKILDEWLEVNGWIGCTSEIVINDAKIEEPNDKINMIKAAIGSDKWMFINEARALAGLPDLDEEQLKELNASSGGMDLSMFGFGPQKKSRVNIDPERNDLSTEKGAEHEPNKIETELLENYESTYDAANDALVAGITNTDGGAVLNEPIVNAIIDKTHENIVVGLAKDAGKGYVNGSVFGYAQMNVSMTPDVLTDLRMRTEIFINDYANLAIRDGVTIINGEPNDWISRFKEDDRKSIYDIINQGIRDGKYPGVKESATGTYPKNTIGYDLAEYFDDRKSHATTVARTETGRSMNIGRLESFAEKGVTKVVVLDGDGKNPCDICNMLNGSTWSIDFAMDHELEHPNCVRSFAPVRPSGGFKTSTAETKLFKTRLTMTKYIFGGM